MGIENSKDGGKVNADAEAQATAEKGESSDSNTNAAGKCCNIRLELDLIRKVKNVLMLNYQIGNETLNKKLYSKVVERALREYCILVEKNEINEIEKKQETTYFKNKIDKLVLRCEGNNELLGVLKRKINEIELKLTNLQQK